MTAPARTWETGFAIAVGFVAAIAGSLLAAWCFPPQDTWARVALLAVVVATGMAMSRRAAACLPVAVIALLFCDGFLVDRAGELHWHGADDVLRFLALLGAAAAGALLGHLVVGDERTPAGAEVEIGTELPADALHAYVADDQAISRLLEPPYGTGTRPPAAS